MGNISGLFKKYKNIFGIPGEGIHRYRFLNTAIVDFIGAIILACLITYVSDIPLVLTTKGVLELGLLLHVLFGVETSSIKYIRSKFI